MSFNQSANEQFRNSLFHHSNLKTNAISRQSINTSTIVNAVKSLVPLDMALGTGVVIFDQHLNVEFACPRSISLLYPHRMDDQITGDNLSNLLLPRAKCTEFHVWRKLELTKMKNEINKISTFSHDAEAMEADIIFQSSRDYIGNLPFRGSDRVSCNLTLLSQSNFHDGPTTLIFARPTAERYIETLISKVAKESRFTRAEEVTAQFMIEGLSNREIAEKRFVSLETVKSQVQSVLRKAGNKRRSDFAHRILLQHRSLN